MLHYVLKNGFINNFLRMRVQLWSGHINTGENDRGRQAIVLHQSGNADKGTGQIATKWKFLLKSQNHNLNLWNSSGKNKGTCIYE